MNKKKLATIAVIAVFVVVIVICFISVVKAPIEESIADNEFSKLKEKVTVSTSKTEPTAEKQSDVIIPNESSNATEPSQQPTHSVDELLGMNKECYAWISIKDTRISYPVMHTPSEPDKYLNKNFYGQTSSSGVPYMDARCSDNSDNKIIFGHHMNYGSMFSDLCNYTRRMYRDSHQDIVLETHKEREVYKVFAVLRVKADDYWYNFITAETEKKYDKKISYAIDHSLYKTRIVPKFGQKLLSLSTCMGSNRDDRLLVIGVKQ